MQVTTKFDQLCADILKRKTGTVRTKIESIIDSAFEYADAMVYIQQRKPEEKWDDLAIENIEMILTFGDSRATDAVRAWFAEYGYGV